MATRGGKRDIRPLRRAVAGPAAAVSYALLRMTMRNPDRFRLPSGTDAPGMSLKTRTQRRGSERAVFRSVFCFAWTGMRDCLRADGRCLGAG